MSSLPSAGQLRRARRRQATEALVAKLHSLSDELKKIRMEPAPMPPLEGKDENVEASPQSASLRAEAPPFVPTKLMETASVLTLPEYLPLVPLDSSLTPGPLGSLVAEYAASDHEDPPSNDSDQDAELGSLFTKGAVVPMTPGTSSDQLDMTMPPPVTPLAVAPKKDDATREDSTTTVKQANTVEKVNPQIAKLKADLNKRAQFINGNFLDHPIAGLSLDKISHMTDHLSCDGLRDLLDLVDVEFEQVCEGPMGSDLGQELDGCKNSDDSEDSNDFDPVLEIGRRNGCMKMASIFDLGGGLCTECRSMPGWDGQESSGAENWEDQESSEDESCDDSEDEA